MPRRTDGFSLIEAVVAIAIMAILAGATLPLLVKSLNQQREQNTRTSLQMAWQAAFGVPGTRVANMRADFGFDPAGPLANLGMMMVPGAPPGVTPPLYATTAPLPYFWGWNGPYWNGSTTTAGALTVPADGWGRPIQLVNPAPNTYQMYSLGADGLPNTADDLYYPPLPVNLLSAYTSKIYISFTSNRGLDTPAGSAAYQGRSGGSFDCPLATPVGPVLAWQSSPTVTFTVKPGPVNISINFPIVPGTAAYPGGYPAMNSQQIVDLLPGETRAITITLN